MVISITSHSSGPDASSEHSIAQGGRQQTESRIRPMLCNCASFFPIPFAVLLLSPRLPRESLSHVERISDRPWPGKRFRSRPEPDSCMEHITNTTICHIKTRALSFAKVRSPESDGSKTSSTLQLAPGGGGLVVG